MATFEFFSPQDRRTESGVMEMLFDLVGSDISSSATRRKYQVWVTGSGTSTGVTSSLFQTVYDQDFTLQTANPVLDLTVGLHTSSNLVSQTYTTYDSVNDQYYFPSSSMQMREKIDMYRTFAQQLLGDSNAAFTFITGSLNGTEIKEAMFIDFKRLFVRDQIKRETFAMRMFASASAGSMIAIGNDEQFFTDLGSSRNVNYSFPGGSVGTIVNTSNTGSVGLIWHDQGIAVLDVSRIMNVTQSISGTIESVTTLTQPFTGSILSSSVWGNSSLFYSGSMDDILDTVCQTRFTGSNDVAMAFKNQTVINSSVYVCNFGVDRFNYSSNPTYTDSTGRIVVIDPGQEDIQRSFSFVTGIGLYDGDNNCLAVAKLSRPVMKDNQRSFPVKVQLNY